MVRRKGARAVPRPLDRWSSNHPVARAMQEGSGWFNAWASYKAMTYGSLERLAGIPKRRLMTMDQGGAISCAELDALACAWSISTGDLISSMAGTVEIIP